MEPSAPPPECSQEKSSMMQAPPPPYQDHPSPGYPQAGYWYPAPGHPSQYGVAGYAHPPPSGGQPYQGQPYPGQQTAVTVQPVVCMTRTPLQNPVNDYLGYSIFTMLCCCLPLGIAALIYSFSAREANLCGDRATAERSSSMARTLNHVGLGIGLTGTAFCIVAMIMTLS